MSAAGVQFNNFKHVTKNAVTNTIFEINKRNELRSYEERT
jgi:hypothetical protein